MKVLRVNPYTIALAFLVALLAAGCSPRANLSPAPEAARAALTVPVYVGTTRHPTSDGLWSRKVPAPLNYAVIDVSVPEERTPGLVVLPDRNPDVSTDYLTQAIQPFADRASFRASAAKKISGRGADQGDIVVTVHGFNNRMGDGVFRTAQMVADFGLRRPTFHYAWPSHGSPLGYAADRDAALLARNGLEAMLDDLSRAGARSIVLVAHSMGSQLTMEVLRQMALNGSPTMSKIGGVILMSPDISPGVFVDQARDIGTLPRPFVIFTSQRDPALRLSARLTGVDSRLGNLSTITPIAGLEVIVIDLSGAKDASSKHLAAVSSPAVIRFLQSTDGIRRALETTETGDAGLVSGTVLLAQEATTVLLAPAALVDEQ